MDFEYEKLSEEDEEEGLESINQVLYLPTGNKNVQLTLDRFDYLPKIAEGIPKVPVMRYTWKTRNRMTVQLINYGSIITCIKIPDKRGNSQDVLMGYDNIIGYLSANNPYFGATIGRVANIIRCSRYSYNDETFYLRPNKPPHHFNGGVFGFDKVLWDHHNEGAKVIMSYTSRANAEGYPGNVIVNITYEVTETNNLLIDISASSDKVTPINITNSLYLNLAGHAAGPLANYKHIVQINADKYTPLMSKSVPTGKIAPVGGTVFDFRTPRVLGIMIKKTKCIGYNHNLCIKLLSNSDVVPVARIYHPDTGRLMEIHSDQPGLQFHTANLLPSIVYANDEVISKYNAALDDIVNPKGYSKTSQKSQTEEQYTKYPDDLFDETKKDNIKNKKMGKNKKRLSKDLEKSSKKGEGVTDLAKSKGTQKTTADLEKQQTMMTTEHNIHKGLAPHHQVEQHTASDNQKEHASHQQEILQSDVLAPLQRGTPCTLQCPCAMTEEQRMKMYGILIPNDKTKDKTSAIDKMKDMLNAADTKRISIADKKGEQQKDFYDDDVHGDETGAISDVEDRRKSKEGRYSYEGSISQDVDYDADVKTSKKHGKHHQQNASTDANQQHDDDWILESDYDIDKDTIANIQNFSHNAKGKEGVNYIKHGAFVMQTQSYPNAVNQKNFPPIWLHPKENYRHRIIYKFGIIFKPDEQIGVVQVQTQTEDTSIVASFHSNIETPRITTFF